MADIYRAREAFAFTSKGNGLPRIVTPGSLMSADDPDFKGKEHLFEKVDVTVAKESRARDHGAADAVERATAEPGERRSISTRRHVTKSKDDDAKKADAKEPDDDK